MAEEKEKELQKLLDSVFRTLEELRGNDKTISERWVTSIERRLNEERKAVQLLGESQADTVLAIERLLPRVTSIRRDVDFLMTAFQSKKPARKDKDVEKLFSRVNKLFEKGNPRDALRLAEEGRVKFQTNPEYWTGMGYTYVHVDSYEKALNAAEMAIRLDSAFPEPEYLRLFIYALQDEHKQVLSHFEALAKKTGIPPDHLLYVLLGISLRGTGSLESADRIAAAITHPARPDCTPCLKSFLYISIKEGKRALAALADCSAPRCRLHALVKGVALGQAGLSQGFLEQMRRVDLSVSVDLFAVELLTAALEQLALTKSCKDLVRFVKDLMKKPTWPKGSDDVRASMLGYAGTRLLVCGCQRFDLVGDLFEKASRYDDSPDIRALTIGALSLLKRPSKAAQAARRALEKHGPSAPIVVFAAHALAADGDAAAVNRLIEVALGIEDIVKDPREMRILRHAAETVGSPLTGKLEQVLSSLPAESKDK